MLFMPSKLWRTRAALSLPTPKQRTGAGRSSRDIDPSAPSRLQRRLDRTGICSPAAISIHVFLGDACLSEAKKRSTFLSLLSPRQAKTSSPLRTNSGGPAGTGTGTARGEHHQVPSSISLLSNDAAESMKLKPVVRSPVKLDHRADNVLQSGPPDAQLNIKSRSSAGGVAT